jgi:pyruvate, water dikinase
VDVQTQIRCFSEIDGLSISNDLTKLILGVDRVGICGGAPANYPKIARFLAELGIDSISVKAASLYRAISVVYEAEQALGSARAAE